MNKDEKRDLAASAASAASEVSGLGCQQHGEQQEAGAHPHAPAIMSEISHKSSSIDFTKNNSKKWSLNEKNNCSL
jgi:hypothetical protein